MMLILSSKRCGPPIRRRLQPFAAAHALTYPVSPLLALSPPTNIHPTPSRVRSLLSEKPHRLTAPSMCDATDDRERTESRLNNNQRERGLNLPSSPLCKKSSSPIVVRLPCASCAPPARWASK